MAKFILLRHGETEWNLNERFRGRADLFLNGRGLKQAEAAASMLKNKPIKTIYSSPLKRTFQTASSIAKIFNLTVQIHGGLIDIDYGEWQGLTANEAIKKNKKLYDDWLNTPYKVRFPKGESLDIVRNRVVEAVNELANKHGNDMVVLVSHKVVCQVLICAILGVDNSHFWQIRQDVCAINTFEYEKGNSIVNLVNDVCHLQNLH